MNLKVKRIELSISTGYVLDWGIKEAVREIIQNAIDQANKIADNEMSIEETGDILIISNKTSKLTRASLVLGASTKTEEEESIGKFGEGYKLALLVLLRSGVEVVIHNYGEKETWVPEICYSNEYKTNVLVINIYKQYISKPKHGNLVFQLNGVKNIKEILSSIMLDETVYSEVIETKKGKILRGGPKGNIYVNGLFVGKRDENDLEDSYSFHPKYLKIGRDRNLIDNFDLKSLVGEIRFEGLPSEEIVKEVINSKPDISYLDVVFNRNTYNEENKIQDKIAEIKQGLCKDLEYKIPVKTQKEADYYKSSTDSIVAKQEYTVVNSLHYSLIGSEFKETMPKTRSIEKKEEDLLISEMLEHFYEKLDVVSGYYGKDYISLFKKIKNKEQSLLNRIEELENQNIRLIEKNKILEQEKRTNLVKEEKTKVELETVKSEIEKTIEERIEDFKVALVEGKIIEIDYQAGLAKMKGLTQLEAGAIVNVAGICEAIISNVLEDNVKQLVFLGKAEAINKIELGDKCVDSRRILPTPGERRFRDFGLPFYESGKILQMPGSRETTDDMIRKVSESVFYGHRNRQEGIRGIEIAGYAGVNEDSLLRAAVAEFDNIKRFDFKDAICKLGELTLNDDIVYKVPKGVVATIAGSSFKSCKPVKYFENKGAGLSYKPEVDTGLSYMRKLESDIENKEAMIKKIEAEAKVNKRAAEKGSFRKLESKKHKTWNGRK